MPVSTALVVDDSKSARVMLSRMLQSMELEVTALESGEDALAYLDTHPMPDTIFMDHMMPGLDGVETITAIHDKHSQPSPMYMYTSKEGSDYETMALKAGAKGLLGKPATLSRLKEIIEDLNDTPQTALVASQAQTPVVDSQPLKPENTNATSTDQQVTQAMKQQLIEETVAPMMAAAIEQSTTKHSAELDQLRQTLH